MILKVGILFATILCSFLKTAECIRGWNQPRGLITLEEGSELRIKCGVENGDSNENVNLSSQLSFFVRNEQGSEGSEKIDRKYVNILNETAIELVIPNVPVQESMIICRFNRRGVTYNDIKVGRKPEEIDHIDCTSKNWEELKCTFKKPYNPVYVQYELSYRIELSNLPHNCQIEPSEPGIFQCTMSSYRRYNPKFVLHLHSNNPFGSRNQTFDFNNYANVIPGKVDELRTLPTSKSDSITISWLAPQKLAVFPEKFDVEISLTPSPDCGGGNEKFYIYNFPADKGTSSRNFEEPIFEYTIPVKCLDKWNDVGVRMKVATAKDEDKMWGEMAKIKVYTSSCARNNPNEIGKIRSARATRITSQSIEVEWELDCRDSGIVAGYLIEYCPTNNHRTLECIPESEMRQNFTADITKYELEGLKSYTIYKIVIRMFSYTTMGEPSEPLVRTTLEDSPSEVANLVIRNVKSTSADFYWDQPVDLNGVFYFNSYNIWVNGIVHQSIRTEQNEMSDNGTRMKYTLKNLLPNEDYDIGIQACTNKCSVSSRIYFRTAAKGN